MSIRYAEEFDIPFIKQLTDRHRKELGFINNAILKEAQQQHQIRIIEDGGVFIGFIRFRIRKDEVAVIYDIVVEPKRRGYGTQLIQDFEAIVKDVGKQYIRLKCPVELEANSFYKKMKFHLIGTEIGKRKGLNIWQRVINPS